MKLRTTPRKETGAWVKTELDIEKKIRLVFGSDSTDRSRMSLATERAAETPVEFRSETLDDSLQKCFDYSKPASHSSRK